MSTANLGLKNDRAQGGLVDHDDHNDQSNTIDNQLHYLRELTIVDGVIAGWGITATDDLNVGLGEGWVGGAHCETTGDQAITGLTANVLNYI